MYIFKYILKHIAIVEIYFLSGSLLIYYSFGKHEIFEKNEEPINILKIYNNAILEEITFRLPCIIICYYFPRITDLVIFLQSILFGLCHYWTIKQHFKMKINIILTLLNIMGAGWILGYYSVGSKYGFAISCVCHIFHNILVKKLS